ncbi:MAG: HAD family hydrolase [Fidelibacterota bacterium]
MPKLLILIDIDGTLLYPGMAPRYALAAAIEEFVGKTLRFEVDHLAGMTDPLIVADALRRLNIPAEKRDGLPEKILDRYLVLLQRRYPDAEDHHLYPGTLTLLNYLQSQAVRLGLISGNLEQGARIKLAPFNLMRYFSLGVFSNDHARRDRLPTIALEKCRRQFKEDYPPQRVIIIGDTIRDVRCAHRNAMRAIAVVRHAERRAGIEAEKPDLIVENFEDITPIRKYIESFLM